MIARSTLVRCSLIAGAALAVTLAPTASEAQQAAPLSPTMAPQQPAATAPRSAAAPPGYGATSPGYGAAPPGYGAAPPGYGVAPPGYGIAPPGYGVAPPGYGYTQPLPPDTEPKSFGMMVSGVLLMSFGATGALVGASMVIAATKTPEITPCFPGAECTPTRADHSALEAVGVTTIVVSSLAAIGGIPLYVIGAKNVPVKPEETALRPEVRVGPTGGALRWHF